MTPTRSPCLLPRAWPERVATSITNWLPATWLVAFGFVVACTLTTLLRSPPIWQDEVQITDFYRVSTEPTTIWAIQMDSSGKPTVAVIPWLSLAQKVVLGPLGIRPLSVRLLGLLSAAAFASSFWVALWQSGWSPWPAAWIALLVICDPGLAQSHRGGRVDLLAMAASMAAYVFWVKASTARSADVPAGLAGFFAVVAPLIWTTAVILNVGLLMAGLLLHRPVEPHRLLRVLTSAIFGALAAAVVSLLLFLCDHRLVDMATFGRYLGSRASATASRDWTELLALHRGLSGGVWLLTFCLLLFAEKAGRARLGGWLVALALAVLAMLCMPPIYIHRLVYLIPLCYLAAIDLLRNRPLLLALTFLCLAATNLGFGVGGRTFQALGHWEERDPARLGRLLDEHVPPGAVVMGGFAYYFHGLERGWEMYETVLPDWRVDLRRRTDVFFVSSGPLAGQPLGLNWRRVAELPFTVRAAGGAALPLHLYRHHPGGSALPPAGPAG